MRKIEKFRKLHEISTVLLSEKKLERVLDAIVKNAARFFLADACSILLFDEKREFLTIANSYKLSKAYLKIVKVRYDEEVAGKVVSKQKAIIIPDLEERFASFDDDLSVKWFKKEGLVSCVDAPVIVKKKSIGCLNLYYKRKYIFRKKDLDVLKVFCDFSAIAIYNADLIERIRDELKERTVLEDVGIALTSTLELKEVLKIFIRAAVDLTGSSGGSIVLVDEQKKAIIKAYNYHKKDEKLESYSSTARLDKGVSGKVLKARKEVTVSDLSKRKDVNPMARKKKRRGVLAVPVLEKKKIIAILYVDSLTPREYTKEEVKLVCVLANQAGAAIENARLYTQIEQKIRDLSISYKISQALISTLDVDVLLAKILDELKSAFGYLNLAILLIDKDTKKLGIKAATGYPDRIRQMKLKVGKDGITGYVAATGKTYYSRDVLKDKHYIKGISNVKSEVSIPLKIGNKIIGVLDVESKEYDGFDEWEIELLSSIAAQIANAIEKLRLYEETKLLSLTDPLTNLPNRRHFDIVIDSEIKRSERYNRPLSLLLIDFDNFKQYNDANGHLAGDKVLIEYSVLMKSCVRDIDLICRYGGDEFVVVLPETDESFSKAVAERIRKKVSSAAKKMGITLSIGVAMYPLDGEEKDVLVMAADKACYIAKERGGNCVRSLLDRK